MKPGTRKDTNAPCCNSNPATPSNIENESTNIVNSEEICPMLANSVKIVTNLVYLSFK